jgi:hypothetical protein
MNDVNQVSSAFPDNGAVRADTESTPAQYVNPENQLDGCVECACCTTCQCALTHPTHHLPPPHPLQPTSTYVEQLSYKVRAPKIK